MNQENAPKLLTREDLVNYFHCSLRHVDNLRMKQGLPWVQVGRKVLFRAEDVQEWISRKSKNLNAEMN